MPKYALKGVINTLLAHFLAHKPKRCDRVVGFIYIYRHVDAVCQNRRQVIRIRIGKRANSILAMLNEIDDANTAIFQVSTLLLCWFQLHQFITLCFLFFFINDTSLFSVRIKRKTFSSWFVHRTWVRFPLSIVFPSSHCFRVLMQTKWVGVPCDKL